MGSRQVTRLLLSVLATVQLIVGSWALLAPESFFTSFPADGRGWVSAYGPFNQHLVVDAGAGFFATGVSLAVAAWWLRRPAVVVALVAYLGFAVPHLLFHVQAPGPGLPLADQVANVAGLLIGVVVAGLLLATWVRQAPPASSAGQVPRSGQVRSPGSPPASAPAEFGDDHPGAQVPPIDGSPSGLVLRLAFWAARRQLGTVPASWRTLAHVPRLAVAWALADRAYFTSRHVSARLHSLAELRAAIVVECAWCIDIGSAVAAGHGVAHEQLQDLPRWRESRAFDPDERLVLELADAVTGTPATVHADLRGELLARFGEEGAVELFSAVAYENARARANHAFGLQPQGFAAAAECRVPELPAP